MTHTRPKNAPADLTETVPEYLARYTPRKLDRTQWARLRADFVTLVEQTGTPTPRAAAVLCSVLADFLRHCLALAPATDLVSSLTQANLNRYLDQHSGKPGSKAMRKTALLRLHDTNQALPRRTRKPAKPGVMPLSATELISLTPRLAAAPTEIHARLVHDLVCGVVVGAVGKDADAHEVAFPSCTVTTESGQSIVPNAQWAEALTALASDLSPGVPMATRAQAGRWLTDNSIDLAPNRLQVAWRISIANTSGATACTVLRDPRVSVDALRLPELAHGLPGLEVGAQLLRGSGTAYAPAAGADTVSLGSCTSTGRSRGPGSAQVASATRPTMSKAATRRLRKEIAGKATAEPDPLSDQNAAYLSTYKPSGLSEPAQTRCRDAVVEVMRRVHHLKGPANFSKHCSDVAALAGWADGGGHSLDWKALMDHGLIHSYARSEPAGLSEKHLAERMRRLKALASQINAGTSAPPPAAPVPHTAVQDPYTQAEMAVIERVARNQPKDSVRRQLAAIIGLCRGAGAGRDDLRFVTTDDIQDLGEAGIRVALGAPEDRRVVPVRRQYEDLVRRGVEGLKPSSIVLGTVPGRRNIANDIISRAEILGSDCPRIEASRLRSTWLAELMLEPIPLGLLLQAAGLKSARSLTDILAWLPPQAGDAMDMLRGDQR